jgi:hypothetical protein
MVNLAGVDISDLPFAGCVRRIVSRISLIY